MIRSAEGEDVNTESNSISTLPRIQKAVVAKPPSLKSGEAVKADVVEEVNVTFQPNSAPTAPDPTTLEAPGHNSNMYAEFADFGLDDLE